MKKILIITYYWPPSGGSGVQRWLKFVKYLPQYGYQPIIFTPENPNFDINDNSLFKDVHPDTEVIKFPIWEPYRIFQKLKREKSNKNINQGDALSGHNKSLITRFATWLRANFLIPDPRVFWVRPSVKFLDKYLEANNIDCIITTGPPHSMHLIGLRLKKMRKIKWMADFRDPWSKWDILQGLEPGRIAIARHQKLERQVIQQANSVITVSSRLADDLSKLGGKQVGVITNGYDEDDVPTIPIGSINKKFVITFVGIMNELRNPPAFWEALKEIIIESPSLKSIFEVKIIGFTGDSVVKAVEKDAELNSITIFKSYLPHEKIFNEYINSSVLMISLNKTDNGKWIIPAKLFEYLAVGKPILSVGEIESDASDIIRELDCGMVADFDDKTGIKTAILTLYKDYYLQDKILQKKDVTKYSRRQLTKKLSQLLDKMVQK